MRPAAATGFRAVECGSLFPRWAGPLNPGAAVQPHPSVSAGFYARRSFAGKVALCVSLPVFLGSWAVLSRRPAEPGRLEPWNRATPGFVGTAALATWGLTSTNLYDTFVRYVAAETDDTANGANSVYVGLAKVNWQTNYQGTVKNQQFTPSAPQAITSDASFSLASSQGAAFPILVTSTSANQAAQTETWRQTVAPLSTNPSASSDTINGMDRRELNFPANPSIAPLSWGEWTAQTFSSNFDSSFVAGMASRLRIFSLENWLWYV